MNKTATDKATRLVMELKTLIGRFEHQSFTMHICYLANAHVRQRSGLVKLSSPVRQLMYLMSLYHATDFKGKEIYSLASSEHKRIIKLLNEIEMCYGYRDLRKKGKKLSETEFNRVVVTNGTFLNYYLNAPLSFFEQDVERIRRTFQHFEPYIIAETGLSIQDFIDFFKLLTSLEIKHASRYLNPDYDEDEVMESLRRGKNPNMLSLDQKIHLMDLAEKTVLGMTIPLDEIYAVMDKEKAKTLLTCFTLFRKENPDYMYYTDICQYLRQPIVLANSEHIVMVYSKQLINAIYEFLFDLCTGESVPGRKVSERRDEYLEEKTAEVLREFFGTTARIYSSYYINGNEKDLLVLIGKNAFIVECKANKYRTPLRDPVRAYERISGDFKKSISKGYTQAKEVEDLFYGERPFVIRDRNKNLLETIRPEDYEEVFTIVVTQERFGQIQCDLSYLLSIGDEDNYPWAVAIDDLESFLITLRRKDNYLNEFIEFLLSREQLQERVFCYDELELCAYFLFSRETFISNCSRSEIFLSSPDMNQFFDLLYQVGFGFKDELNIVDKVKREHLEAESVIKFYNLKPAERVQEFLIRNAG